MTGLLTILITCSVLSGQALSFPFVPDSSRVRVVPVSEDTIFVNVPAANRCDLIEARGIRTNLLPINAVPSCIVSNQLYAFAGNDLIAFNCATRNTKIIFAAATPIKDVIEAPGVLLITIGIPASELVALKLSDYNVAWRIPFEGALLDVSGNSIYARAKIFNATSSGILSIACVALGDGTRLWTKQFPGTYWLHDQGNEFWLWSNQGLRRHSARNGKLLRAYTFKSGVANAVIGSTPQTTFLGLTTGYEYPTNTVASFQYRPVNATNRIYQLGTNEFTFISELKHKIHRIVPVDEKRIILSGEQTAVLDIPSGQIVSFQRGSYRARRGSTIFTVETRDVRGFTLWAHNIDTNDSKKLAEY
jgi:hypothetical protein